jgi:hypothetical protein
MIHRLIRSLLHNIVYILPQVVSASIIIESPSDNGLLIGNELLYISASLKWISYGKCPQYCASGSQNFGARGTLGIIFLQHTQIKMEN